MNETLFHNHRGALWALREVVIALARQNPQAAAQGLENAAQQRELLVASKQPEAFLQGIDVEIAALTKALNL